LADDGLFAVHSSPLWLPFTLNAPPTLQTGSPSRPYRTQLSLFSIRHLALLLRRLLLRHGHCWRRVGMRRDIKRRSAGRGRTVARIGIPSAVVLVVVGVAGSLPVPSQRSGSSTRWRTRRQGHRRCARCSCGRFRHLDILIGA
jgi:hypothetical protein